MNFPSIKTLETATMDKSKAKELRELLKGERKPKDYKSVQQLERQCFSRPNHTYCLMTACNEIMEGFGLEAISKDGYAVYEYVNLGETYQTTLIRHIPSGRYIVGSWGDIVEKGEYS